MANKNGNNSMKAIILAGGKGARLKPYTQVFPKALMPIGDKPILEIIICQLKQAGFSEVTITCGHLAELIQTFFNEGGNIGIPIRYTRENMPLGTAGPLGLLKGQLTETFIMLNGDILTELDYSKLIQFHRESKAAATLAVNRRQVKIDFGVPIIDAEATVAGYSEKPVMDYQVSMGIYVLEPRVLDHVHPNQYLDVPELILKLIAQREKVKAYIHDGFWLDIGRYEDFQKANEEAEEIYKMLHIT
jgi:NDP-sugar pyrophosphorylase family protein